MEARRYRRLFLAELILIFLLMFVITNKHVLAKYISNSSGLKLFGCFYIFRTVLLLHAFWCALKWMYFSLVKKQVSTKHPGIKLMLFAFSLAFLLGEVIFMFIPQAQGNTQSGLGDVPWNIYYTKYHNEKRYRDKDISDRINNGKKKVFFLGDSFTYGNGIKDPSNRFSDIVADRIGKKGFEALNLGKGNSDTRDEFVRLVQYGYKPDVLVLQYYFNDVEPIARSFTGSVPSGNDLTTMFFKTSIVVAQTSFFLNFIAVNLAKFTVPFQSGDFKKRMATAYHDPNVMKQHLNDLQNIINYCVLNHAKLYVLLIPDMREPSFTERDCYPPLIKYLDKKSIPYINIYEDIKDKPVSDLVVSSTDAHANEAVQKIIAEKLLRSIREFK